jgi:hypothetical protein
MYEEVKRKWEGRVCFKHDGGDFLGGVVYKGQHGVDGIVLEAKWED